MKFAKDLTLEECHELIGRIVKCLYLDYDEDNERPYLNPNNEWAPNTLDDIATNLEVFDLVPDKDVYLDTPPKFDSNNKEEIIDFVIKEWDEEHMGPLPANNDVALRSFEDYYHEQNTPLPWRTHHDK